MIRDTDEKLKTSFSYIDNEVPFVDSTLVDEFKQFARIDNNAENTSLQTILATAFQACEKYLGRALITRRMQYGINVLSREVDLPYPPLQSVDGVYIRQEDGSLEAIPTTDYYALTERIPGSVVFVQTKALPVAESEADPFVIKYTAGYGDNLCDIPDAIRQAIIVWANDIYQNRVVQPEPPIEVKPLLMLYSVERI